MKLAGAVLAGGQSRRMGRDKAGLSWRGQPLWLRQLAVLRSAGARPVALVRRPDQTALARRCWRDRHRGCGPLAGISAAFTRARRHGASHLAILAVDMPFVSADWFRDLAADLAPGRGVIARHGSIFEPLAAIYPLEGRTIAAEHLRDGRLSLQELAQVLADRGLVVVRHVSTGHLRTLRSVNTPKACRSNTAKSWSRPRARASTRSRA